MKYSIGKNPNSRWNKGLHYKLGKMSDECKRKISESCKGKNTWARGSKASIEKRIKTSETMKKRVADGKHNNYRGGVTPLRKQIRECAQYKIWRTGVFQRDGHRCVMKGCRTSRGKYIEADHYPKKFADIMVENDIKTLAEAVKCKEFWKIKNGRTLCSGCHKKVTFNK